LTTFLERYGLVQYHKTRHGRYERGGPCELDGPGARYCGELVLDHCHEHGWIRGVICQGWNMSLAGPHGYETSLRTGAVRFECRHVHRVQVSADRCTTSLRRASDPWLRVSSYLGNCPDCWIPEPVIRFPVLAL